MAKTGHDRAAELNALVTSIDAGGFAPAARLLGVTASAISKKVNRLEARLGVRLLNRTTRSLAPTPEGEAFLARGRRILAELDEAEEEAARFRSTPRGTLRLHSLVAIGLHQLPPLLTEFLQRYPEMRIELSVSDRAFDLVEEGVDMALRHGVLPDSTLIGRKVCDMHRLICASPAYLRRRGTPRTPDELLEHDCVVISTAPDFRRWPFDDPTAPGGTRTLDVGGRINANNAESVLQMGLLGAGVIRLVDAVVGEHIRAGRLVPILTDCHHVEPLPLSIVYPQGRLRSPKVAAMVDFLIEKLGPAPWRAVLDGRSQRRAVATDAVARRGGGPGARSAKRAGR